MKFSANRNELLEALTITGKAIGTSIIPILGSYLFKINDDKIEVTGGSMDLYIKNTIEIPPSGLTVAIGVPKSKLFDLIKDSPNQLIDFEIIKNEDLAPEKIVLTLKVTTSIGEYIIPIEPGDDYPFMKIEDPTDFTISQKNLLTAIESTLFACGDDSLKVEITGVNVKLEGTKVEFAATNGFIVSTRTVELGEPSAIKNAFLLPQRVLSVLQSSPSDENIKVRVTKRNVEFRLSDDLTIESMLLDAKFPDHKSVIPTDHVNHLVIRKAQLYGSVKRVSRFSDATTTMISLDITENQCIISTDNDYGEKAEETFAVDKTKGEVKISMSGKQLLASLGKITSDNILISFDGPDNVMLFRHTDDLAVISSKENLILIVPMHLKN